MQMKAERRNFARITVNIPAALSLIQVDAYHTGAIANLSRGGCFFPMASKLPLGEECDISITTGEGAEETVFNMKGRIVRSDGVGVGIKFMDDQEQIAKLLKKLYFKQD